MDAPRRAVAKEFQQFLETYTLQAGKPALYVERIKVRARPPAPLAPRSTDHTCPESMDRW